MRRVLIARGVQVLAVTASESDPDRIVVYLHGLGGPAMQENAFHCLSALPWVAQVRVSEQTRSILLVQLHPAPGAAPIRS